MFFEVGECECGWLVLWSAGFSVFNTKWEMNSVFELSKCFEVDVCERTMTCSYYEYINKFLHFYSFLSDDDFGHHH